MIQSFTSFEVFSNYISQWLITLVTAKRVIAAVLPIQFLSLGKPRLALPLTVLTSLYFFASICPHLVQYRLITYPSNLHPWYTREHEFFEQSWMPHTSSIHQIIPFRINVIAASSLILSINRSQAHIHHLSTRDTLKQQASQRIGLLLGPFIYRLEASTTS